ncbi:39 kDa FK506-binding nuclear protein-like [Drosophila guanche]|uniref:39 kDa FK506-binding nuclear protein-like n=1 Tax=Drosophila guanche TaxID=7266 RepID=UPI0014720D3D|nr:39 kDa FK506-binding nuclear protein-like [Drosophila guanche]
MYKSANAHPHTPVISALYMKDGCTYSHFVKKTIHLSGVRLEQGKSAQLWLKSKSQERVLANMSERTPKVPLDSEIHTGDKLYLESNGHVIVNLKGSMRDFDHSKGPFRMDDCFKNTIKWVKCEVPTENPFV